MKRLVVHIPVLLVFAALMMPSVGSLLDHHFAERQPFHLHVGVVMHSHTHAFQQTHMHIHGEGGQPLQPSGDGVAAFYNYENGDLITLTVTPNSVADDSMLDFQPSSLFMLPLAVQRQVKSNYIPPPDQPPRFIL